MTSSHFSNGKLPFLSKKTSKNTLFKAFLYKKNVLSGIFGLPVCLVIFKMGIPILKITGQTGSPKIPEKNIFLVSFSETKQCF